MVFGVPHIPAWLRQVCWNGPPLSVIFPVRPDRVWAIEAIDLISRGDRLRLKASSFLPIALQLQGDPVIDLLEFLQ